jgi:hypothetical protein
MRVYLDDERPLPADYDTYVSTADECIALLKTGKVTELSLDHDLGLYGQDKTGKTGYDVAKWIEQAIYTGELKDLPRIRLHTQNPVGKQNMRAALCKAHTFWMERRKNEKEETGN